MPELPEVEITRRRIEPVLVGRRIAALSTTADSYFFATRSAVLRRRLRGRTPTALRRRGKYLVAEIDDGCRLLLHLGMTGQLFSSEATSPRLLSATARASLSPQAQRSFRPDRHTHLRFRFEDGGAQVFFRDVRKFGKVIFLGRDETHSRLEKLGPDALEVDPAAFFASTRRRQIPIKSLLLDQSAVAGVGNIYADEALFLAGVRPGRRAARITRLESRAIVEAVQRVLRRSIETGGSSIRDFVGPDGVDGAYQDERHVYARSGQPCRNCGQRIRKVVIGQRGTHYCPSCQR